MALADYSIDTSGSPESVKRRQAYADALLKQGNDYSPVQSPWQGAARLAQGLLGGYERGQADREEQQGLSAARQQMASLLQGKQLDPTSAATLASNPWATPQQVSAISGAYSGQHQLARDDVADRHQRLMEGYAGNEEKRKQYEFENTPDQYIPNPSAGKPGEPAYIDQLAEATAKAKNKQDMFSPVAPPPAAATPAPNPDGTPTAPPATPVAADPNAIDPKTGRREAFLASLDPRVQDYIKKVANYELDPRTTSVRGGERERLMSAVAHYDPTYDQNTFGSRAKAIKDFSTGPQGNIIRSFDVAIDHLDTLQKAASAMQNGDVRLLNEIRNKWREQTGSDLPTNFEALKPLVSGEVAKAVIGSNNALADREELRHPLNSAGSPQQIAGVIDGYKALMAGQLKGIRKQYEDTTGKKDFDNRVRDTTRQALLGGEKKGEAVDEKTIGEKIYFKKDGQWYER